MVGLFAVGILVVSTANAAAAASPAETPAPVISSGNAPDLSGLSLEELLNVDLKVYSVSKRSEPLTDTAAAVYAITNEELRRIGATSIADSLRIVPGMLVARDDAGAWAISARGFNGRFNNKMLVLIDGRSAYSPLFGGVFWDRIDTMLEDVQQIEVVRGSGGTLWGTNAVNGIVNVTTRSAFDTQGALAIAQGGTQERAYGGVRYGAKVGNLAFRVFGKFVDRDDSQHSDGTRAYDAWRRGMGGFRTDGSIGAGTLTLLGNIAHSENRGQRVTPELDGTFGTRKGLQHTDTGDALARYVLRTGETGSLTAQVWYDHESWLGQAVGDEVRDTGDIDVQYAWTTRQNALVVGAGARESGTYSRPVIDGTNYVTTFVPAYQRSMLANIYAQDEVRFFDDRVRVIAGAKLERDPYTGYQAQPTLRASVRISERQMAWAAVSRAVAEPSRLNENILSLAAVLPANTYPNQPIPVYVVIRGNHDLKAEDMRSAEAGYRIGNSQASLDLAGYYNEYRNLINAGPIDPNPFGFHGNVAVAIPWLNANHGPVWGGEATGRITVTPSLVVAGSYTWLNEDSDTVTFTVHDPSNSLSVRTYGNISDSAEWNTAIYWVDSSGIQDASTGQDLRVRSYVRLDTGFTFRIAKRLELALWGQNLLDERHTEILENSTFVTTDVVRGVYAKATAKF